MGLSPRARPGHDTAKTHGTDAWLERVAHGETGAFDAVYELLAPSIYGLAVHILRDRAQAEEVVQEVMIELWRTAARFDTARGSARAWAMTIAHRRAIDRVRAEQSSTLRHERAARGIGPLIHQQSVPDTVERRWDEQRLRHCIGTLTELQRESVLLAFFDGLTYQEVADLLDVPLSTIKTRIRDGLRRLRTCLQERP